MTKLAILPIILIITRIKAQLVCPNDRKPCPDGSYLFRSNLLNCEFPQCPTPINPVQINPTPIKPISLNKKSCCDPAMGSVPANPSCWERCACCPDGTWSPSLGDGKTFFCGGQQCRNDGIINTCGGILCGCKPGYILNTVTNECERCICPTIKDPVCCEGKMYANLCHASCQGATNCNMGPCPVPRPIIPIIPIPIDTIPVPVVATLPGLIVPTPAPLQTIVTQPARSVSGDTSCGGFAHCVYYNDGCNNCICGTNGVEVCTRRMCDVQGIPRCTQCHVGYRLIGYICVSI